MRLYLDLDSRNFLESPRFPRALSLLELKRRDTDLLELQFLRDTIVQELPAGTVIKIGLKPATAYTADFLASGTFTKSGTGTSTRYLLDFNLNTVPLNAAFAATATEPETLAAMAEIEWTSGTTISSSKTLPVTIANDVIRGDEGEPAELPLFYTSTTSDFKATEEQAEAGLENTSWMTPLRTAQAIAAIAPAAHQHTASAIDGFKATQAEAQTGAANDKWMSPLRVAESIAHRRGAANGLASLDANTQIPRAQLPSFDGNEDLLMDVETLYGAVNNLSQSAVTYTLSTNLGSDVIQQIAIPRGWAVLTGAAANNVIATLPVPAELSVNAGDIIRVQHKGNFQGTLSVRHRTFSSNTWQPSTFTTVASGLGPATYTFRFTGTGWDRIIFA